MMCRHSIVPLTVFPCYCALVLLLFLASKQDVIQLRFYTVVRKINLAWESLDGLFWLFDVAVRTRCILENRG